MTGLSRSQVNAIRRDLAFGDLLVSQHARKRLQERKLSDRIIYNAVRLGDLKKVEWNDEKQNWECTIERDFDGPIRVIVAIAKDKETLVILVTAIPISSRKKKRKKR